MQRRTAGVANPSEFPDLVGHVPFEDADQPEHQFRGVGHVADGEQEPSPGPRRIHLPGEVREVLALREASLSQIDGDPQRVFETVRPILRADHPAWVVGETLVDQGQCRVHSHVPTLRCCGGRAVGETIAARPPWATRAATSCRRASDASRVWWIEGSATLTSTTSTMSVKGATHRTARVKTTARRSAGAATVVMATRRGLVPAVPSRAVSRRRR